MNTRTLLPLSAVTICAAALVGCEWGGVHSGESWNDAYSWANFTGTYKLVNTVTPEETATDGTTTTSSSSKDVTGKASFKVAKGAQSATVNKGLNTPVVVGSVTVTCGNGWIFKDDGAGNLTFQGSGNGFIGSVSYSTGVITLSFGEYHDAFSGTINYSYTVKNGSSYTTPSGETVIIASPIIWLNLRQQGNLLTFEDNAGKSYSGKITGASCPRSDEEGYTQAGHIRFTFEATCTSNPRITMTGSISGDWSGSSSESTGTIANRTIEGSYHDGKSATQFQAVSGSTTVYAREVTPVAGVTE